MLPDDMADISNLELIHMMFPKERREDDMVWLLGCYMSWVYEEAVVKGRRLNDQHIKSYMQYMFFQSGDEYAASWVYFWDNCGPESSF